MFVKKILNFYSRSPDSLAQDSRLLSQAGGYPDVSPRVLLSARTVRDAAAGVLILSFMQSPMKRRAEGLPIRHN
jgi:hypothetical protein